MPTVQTITHCLHGQRSALTASISFVKLFSFSLFIRSASYNWTFTHLFADVTLTFENISRKMVTKSSKTSPASGMFACSYDIFADLSSLVNFSSAIFVATRIFAYTRFNGFYFGFFSIFFFFFFSRTKRVLTAHVQWFTQTVSTKNSSENLILTKHFHRIA